LRNETVDQDVGVADDVGTTVQFDAADTDGVDTGRVRKAAATEAPSAPTTNPRHESRFTCPLSLVHPVSRSKSTGFPVKSQGFPKSECELWSHDEFVVRKGLIVRR
jgi:hypothetical protein